MGRLSRISGRRHGTGQSQLRRIRLGAGGGRGRGSPVGRLAQLFVLAHDVI